MKKTIIKIALPVIAFLGLMFCAQPYSAASTDEVKETQTVTEEITYALGDVNGDGLVNAVDASAVLSAYAKYQTGEEPLTPLQKEAADVNGDGEVNSVDASLILSYYSYLATSHGETVDIKSFQNDKPIETPTNAPKIETEPVEEFSSVTKEKIYFKPNTHYIHKASCHWCNADLGANEQLIEIDTTEGIECRKCSECNPEIEIITPYVESTPVAIAGIDDYSRQLLAEITWHEAGSNWISQYNKAKVVAGVMNRVNDPRFPNTVYSVLVAPNQFTGYWPGCCTPSQACYDAVDYYFSHTNEFNSDNSWWGDGYQNHFYYQ